ncbi:MAG TPA: acetyl-CoA carboxylase biotin carboxyl carrier protein subunit [Ramlibacter sp.]|uniref:acetyl-CoA carboxylase biotin carboxyl carrier protein n=1 Tax=Ramlibacter sp. TaxID=1917967 RepID=UPI002CBAE74A|nr:acetyl-CoA carboxylase biotin carboxyl carrier protein subunit [Ramlibacter sp.]HVZ44905.1 acetyl-CoA carboxylase biotin carboxyl carrier protein subunit [Ramlibacter sp.]
MFGIVHLRSAPGEPPFVKPGDVIEAGALLCTIEAMKVFNEVRAEEACRVARCSSPPARKWRPASRSSSSSRCAMFDSVLIANRGVIVEQVARPEHRVQDGTQREGRSAEGTEVRPDPLRESRQGPRAARETADCS